MYNVIKADVPVVIEAEFYKIRTRTDEGALYATSTPEYVLNSDRSALTKSAKESELL
jgi:hypothetical protein